jgi:hypothetical protein
MLTTVLVLSAVSTVLQLIGVWQRERGLSLQANNGYWVPPVATFG